jgi:hypothetical protein
MLAHGEPKQCSFHDHETVTAWKSGGQDSNLRDVRTHIHPIAGRVAFDPLATPAFPYKISELGQKRLKDGGGRGKV